MNELLCVVYDRLAGNMIGEVMRFKNTTTAERAWDDIMRVQNSIVRLHAEDHSMVQIATLNVDTLEITQDRKNLMTGAQWLAAQPKQESE